MSSLPDLHLAHFIAHQMHSELLSGEYQVPMSGNQFLDLVALLCRMDYYDYAELQRRQEHTFSQVIKTYFPVDFYSCGTRDPYQFIQTKLLVLDKWAKLGRSHTQYISRVDKQETAKSRQLPCSEDQMLFDMKLTSLTYLRHLKNVQSERFGCCRLLCHVSNLPGISEDTHLWIVPGEEQINFLSVGKLNEQKADCQQINRPNKMNYYFKSIPYDAIISYGGLKSGAFFFVYLEMIPGRSQENCEKVNLQNVPTSFQTSTSPYTFEYKRSPYQTSKYCSTGQNQFEYQLPIADNEKQKLILRKIICLLTDVNSVLELTNTLTFFMNAERGVQGTVCPKEISEVHFHPNASHMEPRSIDDLDNTPSSVL